MALNREERRRRIHYRIRKHVNGTPERPRLAVFRSNTQIYAQVIDDEIRYILHQFLYQTGTYSARNVIKKEFLWSPHIFHHATEHPKSEHIKKDMLEIRMHEHVCEQLIDLKIGCKEKMKSENVVQINSSAVKYPKRYKSKQIDN